MVALYMGPIPPTHWSVRKQDSLSYVVSHTWKTTACIILWNNEVQEEMFGFHVVEISAEEPIGFDGNFKLTADCSLYSSRSIRFIFRGFSLLFRWKPSGTFKTRWNCAFREIGSPSAVQPKHVGRAHPSIGCPFGWACIYATISSLSTLTKQGCRNFYPILSKWWLKFWRGCAKVCANLHCPALLETFYNRALMRTDFEAKRDRRFSTKRCTYNVGLCH